MAAACDCDLSRSRCCLDQLTLRLLLRLDGNWNQSWWSSRRGQLTISTVMLFAEGEAINNNCPGHFATPATIITGAIYPPLILGLVLQSLGEIQMSNSHNLWHFAKVTPSPSRPLHTVVISTRFYLMDYWHSTVIIRTYLRDAEKYNKSFFRGIFSRNTNVN